MKKKLQLMAALLACAVTADSQTSAPLENKADKKMVMSSISTLVKEMKKYEGYFTFYYDEKTGKVFLELEKFDEEFLYFSSLSDGVGSGGPERGQASASIAKFQRVGPKVLMVQPNYNFRAGSGDPDESRAVENAFARSVIYGFTPTATEDNKVLIDITGFLMRDAQKIGDRIGSGRNSQPGIGNTAMIIPGSGGGGPSYKIDESRSAIYLPNTRNFPKNTEFETMLTFTGGPTASGRFGGGGIAPDPNAITVKMHQSFVELPDSNYVPRMFDPRSGYGMHSYLDFSAPVTEPIMKRFIRRHRLQKKNPAATVSEPVKPIVYYVDRGAPAPVKKALIEGGAWWNESFGAAGFKNAFIVKELPMDADPMDIRYNIVNWINRTGSPRAFSSGASYTDPRTGEIIKGVVTLGSDRHRQDYLIAEGLLQPYEDGKPVSKQMEELALARIRQLSAHEIGHTLGFTHNFAASPKDRASVMDYPFPRFTKKKDGSIEVSDAYANGIGSWDTRAVIWGYAQFANGSDEKAELDKIMKSTLQQGFQYIPDIGGYVHPASHQWDDGQNAVDQLTKLLDVRRTLLDRFSEKAIPTGAPMATLEEVLVPIYLLHRYQIEATAKSLGGLYFTHAIKNDGQVPTKMVDPAEQWKALDALMATISPEALALPEKLISMIPPRPSGYPAGLETFHGSTGPTFDPVGAAESAAAATIASILNAERAARLVEYQGRDSKQPGFMPVVDKLIQKTWKAPMAEGYKGLLQSMVNNLTLKYLLQLAADTKASEIVRGQSLLKINELKTWMQDAVASASPASKANMLFAMEQVDEFTRTPDKFKPAPASEMPPGAPIGMPCMEFVE